MVGSLRPRVGRRTIELHVLGTIAMLHLAAMFTPGPNVVAVVHTAATESRKAAIEVAVGVAAGALVWAVVASLGIAMLFENTELLVGVTRVAGGAYLVALGIRWIASPPHMKDPSIAPSRRLGHFARGLRINLSNPKSVVFFGSVFASTLPPSASLGLRLSAIALIVADAGVWHLALALTFSGSRLRRSIDRQTASVSRLAGGLLAIFGLRTLLDARTAMSSL